jgi:WD40 repeat protein
VHAKSLWESRLLCWPEAICVSSDGRLVAASDRGPRPAILVWSVKSGKLLKKFHGHDDGIPTLAFSADSTRLASGAQDGTLLIWDVSKARE